MRTFRSEGADPICVPGKRFLKTTESEDCHRPHDMASQGTHHDTMATPSLWFSGPPTTEHAQTEQHNGRSRINHSDMNACTCPCSENDAENKQNVTKMASVIGSTDVDAENSGDGGDNGGGDHGRVRG